MPQNWGNVKNVKSLQKCFLTVLKTGEMLKMLKVLWGIDSPTPPKNKLQAGEMLKMLKVSRNVFLSALKC